MAILTDVPHFDLPFRFISEAGAQTAATVEQDVDKDVQNCIVAALYTYIGWRPEQPDFGTRDLAFSVQPVDTNDIAAQIIQNEPRALLLISQQPSFLDELVAQISINFDVKEGT